MCVYCHDLVRSHAINDETKKKKGAYVVKYVWHIRYRTYARKEQTNSHLAYRDHGGALFYPDPVCRPAPKVGSTRADR